MSKNLYYIGERCNPQLANPYYFAYGQLSKKDANKKENCLYGSIFLTEFTSKTDYDSAIEDLKNKGFRVTNF